MGTYALTGSASGIGAALKSALSKEGHSIIGVDIKNADITADLLSADGRKAAIASVIQHAPEGLDGFIPLAGLGGGTAPDLLITKLNYFGTVELVQGLRESIAKKQGAVVLLCSNSSPMAEPEPDFLAALLDGDEGKALQLAEEKVDPGTHYMQTKRALNYWMRKNMMDYAKDGIRMNAIAPGPTITPMTKPLFESKDYGPIMQSLLEATPAGRAAEAEEIAAAIMFLLSPAASYIYGTCLWADGGFDAHTRPEHI